MTFDYKTWLKTAEDRLAALKNERVAFLVAIDDEIGKLEAGIKAFAPLVEEHSVAPPELGLTDSVRQIFMESGEKSLLAPTAIRDQLLSRGVALEQKNPMATIHQILARLIEKNFAEEVASEGGKYYRWTGQMTLSDLMAKTTSSAMAQLIANLPNYSEEMARAMASFPKITVPKINLFGNPILKEEKPKANLFLPPSAPVVPGEKK